MRPEAVVKALEEALGQLGVRVRREKGGFRGGRCTVDGRDVVVLNRLHPPEAQLAVLAESLRPLAHEQLYLRPAIRAALADAWARADAGAADAPDAEPDDGA